MFNLPASLIESASGAYSNLLYESFMFTEDRITYLKQNNPEIDTSHDSLAIFHTPDEIIDHLSNNFDPSKKNLYSQWILGQYKKQNIRQEDAARVHGALSLFHAHKAKLENKDINQYKSVHDVEEAVAPYRGAPATRAEATEMDIAKGRTLVHDSGDGLKVYRLEPNEHGEAASKAIYGGGSHLGGTHTSWCTAADSEHCMFKAYSTKQNPLHVIHARDGSVFQAHPDTLQLMDANDASVNGNDHDSPAVRDVGEALNHIPGGCKLRITHNFKVTPNDLEAEYGDVRMRKHILENKQVTPSILTKASTDEDGNIRMAAARHPNTPPDVIRALANDKAKLVRDQAIANPKAPGDAVADAVEKDYSSARYISEENPNVPEHTMHKIIDDRRQYGIPYNILASKSMKHEHMMKISDAYNGYYDHDLILNHTDVPHELLHKALSSGSIDAKKVALSHEQMTPELLKIASQDTSPDIRGLAALRPKATQEHLRAALFDNDFYVRNAAASNPSMTMETAQFFHDNDHTPLNNTQVYDKLVMNPSIRNDAIKAFGHRTSYYGKAKQ